MAFHKYLLEVEETLRLLSYMNVIQNHVSAQFVRVVPHRLSMAQFSILHYFSSRRDACETIQGLAHMFGLSKASVGESVEKLAKKKFVSVRVNEEDKRSKLVSITEKGLEAYGDALAALRPLLKDMRDGVGEETFQQAGEPLLPLRDWLRENK